MKLTKKDLCGVKVGDPVTYIIEGKKLKAFVAGISEKDGLTIHLLDSDWYKGEYCKDYGECFCLNFNQPSTLYKVKTETMFKMVCKDIATKKVVDSDYYETEKFRKEKMEYGMVTCAFR